MTSPTSSASGGWRFPPPYPTQPTLNSQTRTYNSEQLAIGLKVKPWKNLLVYGNVTIQLNNVGLRSSPVPLSVPRIPSASSHGAQTERNFLWASLSLARWRFWQYLRGRPRATQERICRRAILHAFPFRLRLKYTSSSSFPRSITSSHGLEKKEEELCQ